MDTFIFVTTLGKRLLIGVIGAFLACGLGMTGSSELQAQTLGGQTIFNFLRASNAPQLSGLGGVNVSNNGNDLSLAFMQPALLRDSMDGQVAVNFNSQYAGVNDYNLMMAYHHPGLNMNFALGTEYVDYGSITQTDPSGNILGDFHPRDFVVQGTAAGRYLDRWFYGFTLKYIGSDLGIYRSNGLAMDVGLNYQISDKGWQLGLAAVNMGTQLKSYDGVNKEELPFDLQIGVSKRLLNAPIQFSLTFDHIHEWNLDYSDSTFNAALGITPKDGFAGHLLEHMIFAAQAFASKYIEVTVGYNYLLRKELSLSTASNGLTGVSLGVGVLLPQFSFRYARTSYQSSNGYNQIGIDIPLHKYIGHGK